jgi:hypothetical protein
MGSVDLQPRSRKKKDGFEIPLVEVGGVDIKFLSKKATVGEVRVILGPCNDPPFLASLDVNVGAEAVAVDVPQMVSTRGRRKPPSSACHRKQGRAGTHWQINCGVKCGKIGCKGHGGVGGRQHWEVKCVEDFSLLLVTPYHVTKGTLPVARFGTKRIFPREIYHTLLVSAYWQKCMAPQTLNCHRSMKVPQCSQTLFVKTKRRLELIMHNNVLSLE